MSFGGWGTFFAGIAGPVAKKALTALGIGVVTMVGVDTAIQGALNSAKAAFGGMTGVVGDIVAISGFFSAVSIIAGGVVAAGSIMVMKKLAVI